jgi:hypothetical protein
MMMIKNTAKIMLAAGMTIGMLACGSSRDTNENKIGELPANPFVTHIYTADPSAHV